MPKIKQISVNQIDKIISCQDDNSKNTTIQYNVDNNEEISIVVTPLLKPEDTSGFVDSVVDAVFVNDDYNTALYELVYSKAILAYYTNIKYDITNEKLNKIVYCTNIIDMIIEKINRMQLSDINDAINKKIEFKKNLIISEQKKLLDDAVIRLNTEQDKMVTQISSLVDVFGKIGKEANEIDINKLSEDVNKIANMDENKTVNNILEFQNKDDKK